MEWFVQELMQFAEDVQTVFECPLPMEKLTNKQEKQFFEASICHICEKPLTKNDKRVRDHNHFNSMFRGAAHESCNLNY